MVMGDSLKPPPGPARTTAYSKHVTFRETTPMLRTIFAIGLFAVLGLFALKLVFGVFSVLFVVFGGLLAFAIKIAIIGLIIYVIIRIVSPGTARKMRNWGEPGV